MMNENISLNRRNFLRCIGAGAVFSGVGGCLFGNSKSSTQGLAPSLKRPNLIVIITDDQGYGDLGCQPHILPIETPNIDRIAENGIRMTDGYACAPICSPSRMGLLQGRYPANLGYYDNWEAQVGLHPDERIAPHYLKQLGYHCAAIGKWHLGWQEHNQPLKKGFDYHFGFNAGMHDYFEADEGETWEGGPFDVNWVTENGKRIEKIKYMPDELTDRTLKFIDRCQADPFFIYLAYTTPHGPHQAKEEDLARYESDEIDPHRKVVRAMYDALDRNIGRLLDHLNDKGMLDNTFIVYSGDNGGLRAEAGCHNWKLRGSKGRLTEGGIRVPFLAQWPKVLPKGKIYAQPVINIDIIPTLFAAAEVSREYLPEMDGVNLLPYWLSETDGSPHETLHWQMHPTVMNRWAIRKGDWKLVYALNGQGLFNLKEDISETTDLRSQHPEITEELTTLHKQWRDKNAASRVNDDTRRIHIWEMRFRHDMGRPDKKESYDDAARGLNWKKK